ncbi:sensor histidine kinase [Sphingomonas rubra]|uniref:sensor histidine kinase n=1 Tax=Sphingomonas rubra TaxID=634430 RepID=UPI001160DD4C|nr:ATP-binding protein [Sphingomonas rubra]
MRKSTHRSAPRRLLAAVAGAAIVVAVLVWAGLRWSDDQAAAVADDLASAAATGHANLLASELGKFRLLPLVLAEYPELAAAFRGEPAARRLDRDLELLADRTGAAVIYAVDASGRTVSASNWRRPTSFVGQRYGFRPYFIDAMQRGAAELFALGTVSGRPGLYLARRIERQGRALGVIVVKVEFDRLEASWRRTPGFTLAMDADGIVLATSRPGWRFAALVPLSTRRLADTRRTLQFGPAPPRRAPVTIAGRSAQVQEPAAMDGTVFRVARTASPLAGGVVLHFTPLAPAALAARSQALLVGLAALLVLAIAGALALRSVERRRLQVAAREELERTVAERTAELRESNTRLGRESEERLAADRRYRAAREELAQASRLGSLGQITAGVAHEISQPIAAIRAYAENGLAFLDRASTGRARDNFDRIVGLTERVGVITGELRAFARRRPGEDTTTTVGRVLDGMLLLTPERTRALLRLRVDDTLRDVAVVGDRIRLEQVLVNLLTNAADAAADITSPVIAIDVDDLVDRVTIRVRDNGPGVVAALRESLFEPFVTGRADGLGLGLPIAREIARDYGGDLVMVDVPEGAEFVLMLTRA